jgi:hypothetical protein
MHMHIHSTHPPSLAAALVFVVRLGISFLAVVSSHPSRPHHVADRIHGEQAFHLYSTRCRLSLRLLPLQYSSRRRCLTSFLDTGPMCVDPDPSTARRRTRNAENE